MIKTKACVIGAGPGGYVAAIRLAQLGVETVIVERMESLGGVCLNWGCIPSKAFISVAKLWDQIHETEDVGIEVTDPTFDMAKTKKWKDGIVTKLTGGIATLLKRNKVKIVHGSARFTGKNAIEVKGEDGRTETIQADRFVIATGSRSIEIPGFEVDQKDVLTSRGALALEEVPDRLLIIGGGVIGMEIGSYMQKFGSEVTIVEMQKQVLPGTDPDCVKAVTRTFKKMGTRFMLESKSKSMKRTKDGIEVTIETPKGDKTVVCDKILVSVGRRPNTENLGLDVAGVKMDQRGFIETDDKMTTSNPAILAIGDVSGPPLLAHKGSKEGLVAAAVIAGKPEMYDVKAMPAAIFTDPEIGSVGMTEEEARAAGKKIKVGTFPFAASGRAMAGRETDGLTKVISEEGTDLLLGCHIAGPHASELIPEAALAIEAGLTAEDLALTVHTHPTLSETVMEAAEDTHNLAVHIYNPPRK